MSDSFMITSDVTFYVKEFNNAQLPHKLQIVLRGYKQVRSAKTAILKKYFQDYYYYSGYKGSTDPLTVQEIIPLL